MSKLGVTLDDLAETLSDFITMVDVRFTGVEGEISEIKSDIKDVHGFMRQTNSRLESLEGSSAAMSNDIKELYALAK